MSREEGGVDRQSIKQVLWLSVALFPVGVWVMFYPGTASTLAFLAGVGYYLYSRYRWEMEGSRKSAPAPQPTEEDLLYRRQFETIVEREDWGRYR